jgi:hypothetical protein
MQMWDGYGNPLCPTKPRGPLTQLTIIGVWADAWAEPAQGSRQTGERAPSISGDHTWRFIWRVASHSAGYTTAGVVIEGAVMRAASATTHVSGHWD